MRNPPADPRNPQLVHRITHVLEYQGLEHLTMEPIDQTNCHEATIQYHTCSHLNSQ
jgi:hypothetical protein